MSVISNADFRLTIKLNVTNIFNRKYTGLQTDQVLFFDDLLDLIA